MTSFKTLHWNNHLRLEVPLELSFVCLFSLSICINNRTVSQDLFIWALIQSRLESQDPIWSLKRLSTARSNTDIHCNTCVSYENNYEPKLLNIREYRTVSINLSPKKRVRGFFLHQSNIRFENSKATLSLIQKELLAVGKIFPWTLFFSKSGLHLAGFDFECYENCSHYC